MTGKDENPLSRAPISYWGGLLVASLCAAWLCANHLLVFVAIAALVLLSGYFVFGLFSRSKRRFFMSFFVVSTMVVGGVLASLWLAIQ